MDKFFLVQIKQTNGTIEKGVVVKDSFEDAKQSYHAYLGAYGYTHDPNTNFVACFIIDSIGNILMWEVWNGVTQQTPVE